MSWVSRYMKSSVGAKHVMAVTGLILSLFVLAHMLGNLLVFVPGDPKPINVYAVGLKTAGSGSVVWLVRLAILGAVVVHIAAGLRLSSLNRAARPVKYQVYRPIRSSFYSRSMAWSGLALLAFITFHLLHYTFGVVSPATFAPALAQPDGSPDVFGMMVYGFRAPAVAITYIVAMAFLCMHLAHGMSSWFQSLGLNHPKYNDVIRYVGPVYAGVIFAGNTMIVLAVLFRLIGGDLPELGA